MLQILEFVFSSFWVWLGSICLLLPICFTVCVVVEVIANAVFLYRTAKEALKDKQ
jgi:hypothetical protein